MDSNTNGFVGKDDVVVRDGMACWDAREREAERIAHVLLSP